MALNASTFDEFTTLILTKTNQNSIPDLFCLRVHRRRHIRERGVAETYLAMRWRRLLNHRALSSDLLALRLKGLEHLPGHPVIKLSLTGISRYPDNHSYRYVSPTVVVFQNMGRCQSTSTYDQNH